MSKLADLTKEQIIAELRRYLGLIGPAASALGVSKSGLTKRIAADEELSDALNDARDDAGDAIEASMIAKAQAGDVAAAALVLKSRFRSRGYGDKLEVKSENVNLNATAALTPMDMARLCQAHRAMKTGGKECLSSETSSNGLNLIQTGRSVIPVESSPVVDVTPCMEITQTPPTPEPITISGPTAVTPVTKMSSPASPSSGSNAALPERKSEREATSQTESKPRTETGIAASGPEETPASSTASSKSSSARSSERKKNLPAKKRGYSVASEPPDVLARKAMASMDKAASVLEDWLN